MPYCRIVASGALLAATSLAPSTPAQLPPGHFAVAAGQTLSPFTPWTGPPGVYVGHPRRPGMMQAVTGLPAALTMPRSNTVNWYGIGAMAMHQPSGDLLIGDLPSGTSPNPVSLYRVRVNANLAATLVRNPIQLGVGTQGDVNQIVQIGANRVVVTCNHVSGAVGPGPMAIAEVNLSTGAVAPWPVAALFGAFQGQAICVDPRSGSAYVGGSLNFTSPSTIYRVPLANPASRSLIATLPVFLDNLQWDANSGTILAGGRSNSPSNGAVFRINPVSGAVTTVLSNWRNAPVITLEPATGDLLLGGIQSSSATQGIWHLAGGSTNPTFLSNTFAPAGASAGIPAGIVVAPDPGYFGSGTTMTPSMPVLPWTHGVLPGGLPVVGNQAFSLQLDLPAGTTVTQFAVASLAGANVPSPLPPLQMWVSLNPSNYLGVLVLGGSTVPLPIPSSAGLQGLSVFFQSLTIANSATGTAIGASDGAKVTIL